MTKNVEERINWLEHQLEDEMVGEHDSDLIKERIGKLQGGLCIVRAGGYSQVEVQETRDRLEDALSAVQAALEQGYVVGGGFALLKAS